MKDTDTGTSQDHAYVRRTSDAQKSPRADHALPLPGKSSGIDRAGLASMEQAERDAIAKRAGQRSPSEKTWALVLAKLERRKAA